MPLSLDPAHTALLAMDCQSGIVSIYAGSDPSFLDRASGVLRAARSAGVQVIHIQVGFRPGLPEVSGRNKLFGAIRTSPQHQKLFEGSAGAISPALGPEPNDIVITTSDQRVHRNRSRYDSARAGDRDSGDVRHRYQRRCALDPA